MRELVASTLVVALLSTSCAPALSRSAALVPRVTTGQTSKSVAQHDSVSALRELARQIPLGKNVRVRTLSGDKIYGKLRMVDQSGVTLEKPGTTAFSKPTSVRVPYETMQSIEKDGMGLGTKIGIVAGLAGVAILGSLAYAFTQSH